MTLEAVRLSTIIATSLSAATILATLYLVPSIINDVNNVWQELDGEMAEFRVSKYVTKE